MSRRIKSFNDFNLSESGKYPVYENSSSTQNKKGDKIDSYRTVSFLLSEIFGLYGFFFAQKQGFFDVNQWPKLMGRIIQEKNPTERWKIIVKMSKFLQEKTKSPSLKPSPGEFGYRGTYDYGIVTEKLPEATELLGAASKAILMNFTPEEKSDAMLAMDEILRKMKPLRFGGSSPVTEAQRYAPPTDVDLYRKADSIGAKLNNMSILLSNLKNSYPDSSKEIGSFILSYISPKMKEVTNFIKVDIPKVSGPAAEGFMKKLEVFDKSVDALIPKVNDLKNKMVSQYQPVASAKEFIESAAKTISAVRASITRQAEVNARSIKAGDVIAGTTNITDPRYSGDLQARSQSGSSQGTQTVTKDLKKKGAEDLADFFTKKYSIR